MKNILKLRKLLWVRLALLFLEETLHRKERIFTCNLFGKFSRESRVWYEGVLQKYLGDRGKMGINWIAAFEKEGFDDGEETAESINNRIMWLFMLLILVEEGVE